MTVCVAVTRCGERKQQRDVFNGRLLHSIRQACRVTLVEDLNNVVVFSSSNIIIIIIITPTIILIIIITIIQIMAILSIISIIIYRYNKHIKQDWEKHAKL